MSTENIVKNRYYRILKDQAHHIWNRISYWTHADDVELSNGTTLSADLATKDAKIGNMFADFAAVESSSTASQSYTKGQCLVYNDQLYKVIAPIASGNTLTVGSNIQTMSTSNLSTMLTASDGNEFYFDVKDGEYGFYPSASKTSSEFVPFSGSDSKVFAGSMGRMAGPCEIQGHTEDRTGAYCILDNYSYYGRVGGTAGTRTYEGTYFTFTTYTKENSSTSKVTATVKVAGKYLVNGVETIYSVGAYIENQNCVWEYLGNA